MTSENEANRPIDVDAILRTIPWVDPDDEFGGVGSAHMLHAAERATR